jgi:hypothetical protein
MPDVSPSLHPGEPRRWVAIDQHKFSILAAVLPPDCGKPEVRESRRGSGRFAGFIERLGGPAGLSLCHEVGPAGSRYGSFSPSSG